jgi:2-polyprenyl-6-methoxyphenol hydroxylase-like FAD-dependent oxidoreductase
MVKDDVLDAVVVGGGPVGLFLGCALARLGLRFAVLEQRSARVGGSRAIGVHAPSLERFAALDLATPLCRAGVPVRRGVVRSSRRGLGAVALSRTSSPFPFALAVPQEHTEALLEERLEALRPGALRRGARVVQVGLDRGLRTAWAELATEERRIKARLVVGCDGRQSVVRRDAHIAQRGVARPESYMMGDFADTTEYAEIALIVLADGGLVESFPLPGGRRRWVAQAEAPTRVAGAEELAR